MPTLRFALGSMLCAAVCAATGCEKSDLPTVPVQGKITFAGGPPPTSGSIVFNPLSTEDGLPRRPGRAQFDEQGNFRVTSFRDFDGLVPGRYQPVISCWKRMPSMEDLGANEQNSYVPQDFEAPELKVERGKDRIEVSFDVPQK